MKLDKNYTIEGDNYNWTLKFEEKTFNKKGEEITRRDQWYYPSLNLALKRYVDESLKPCESVQEVHNKLKELEETIKNLTVC